MDPISKKYIIGEKFQLCSIADLEFSPRSGYIFKNWIDSDGNEYEDQAEVTITSPSFSLSAVWEENYFKEVIPTGKVISSDIIVENDNNNLWWM